MFINGAAIASVPSHLSGCFSSPALRVAQEKLWTFLVPCTSSSRSRSIAAILVGSFISSHKASLLHQLGLRLQRYRRNYGVNPQIARDEAGVLRRRPPSRT